MNSHSIQKTYYYGGLFLGLVTFVSVAFINPALKRSELNSTEGVVAWPNLNDDIQGIHLFKQPGIFYLVQDSVYELDKERASFLGSVKLGMRYSMLYDPRDPTDAYIDSFWGYWMPFYKVFLIILASVIWFVIMQIKCYTYPAIPKVLYS